MKDWNEEDWRLAGKDLLLSLGIVSNTAAQESVGEILKGYYEDGVSDGIQEGFGQCYGLMN